MAFLTAWFVPILLVGGIFFERKYTNKLRKIFAVGLMVSISFQSYKDTILEIWHALGRRPGEFFTGAGGDSSLFAGGDSSLFAGAGGEGDS